MTTRLTKIRSLLAGTCALAVLATTAQAADCLIYGAYLQGTVSLGDSRAILAEQNFQVMQYVVLRTEGLRGNQWEFYTTPNVDLNAGGQVGHIEVMTNSAFARNAGIASRRFDLARTGTAQNGALQFQIDGSMSYVMPMPNVFVAPGHGASAGGLGGLCFLNVPGLCDLAKNSEILQSSYQYPRRGAVTFGSTDKWSTISGQVEMIGTAPDNATTQGVYKASFNGRFLGSQRCD